MANVGRKAQFPSTDPVAYLRSLVKLLIKKARITDPNSPLNGQLTDLFIQSGNINQIAADLTVSADVIINEPGIHVSPGWVDIFAHFGEPGLEQKETIETGSRAALAGGYTDVFLVPNNKPITQDRAGVEYLKQRALSGPVHIHPIGAITKGAEGKELAELYDMYQSGAVAFSDGLKSIQSAGLFLKALQYVKAIGATIIQMPDDRTIQPHGLMHEGIASTRMGLPGRPDISESIQVSRDISLSQYTESNLHLTGVSSQHSIDCIRLGKRSQTGLSCSTTPIHLSFTDEDLEGYNTLLKLNPPLRTNTDREALIQAILDGTIDCLASHHLPQENDKKVCEFEQAAEGSIGLETAFAALRTALPDLPLERAIELLSINPRKIFGLPTIQVIEGGIANLTLFHPDKKWLVDESTLYSRSRNTPFLGRTLTGKPFGIIQNGTLHKV